MTEKTAEKWFSELNLEKLKMFASNWGQAYNVIEKITLYHGSYASGVRYVLVATAPPRPDKEAIKKIQIQSDKAPLSARGENIPIAETRDYYDWAASGCCLQIEDDLRSAYHASGYTRDDWMWHSVKVGEENNEIIALTDHRLINDNFFVTLYEKFKQKCNLTPNQEDKKACQEIAKITHLKFSDYYQQLNLTELKVMAQGWVNLFPVIKQITLYRAAENVRHDCNEKFVLDVRIDDSDKIEYRKFERDWIDNYCYLDRLRDAYKTPGTDYVGEWLFLLGEGEPLPGEKQVDLNSRLVLFPRDEERKQTPKQDVDAFVRELTVTPASDLEIKIKRPGKRPKTCNYERLEFRDNKAKEWETFLGILNNLGGYTVGQSGTPGTNTRKEYDQNLARLRAIDKKLKTAFRKEFSLQFPGGYHLYEPFKTEGRGVYKFKFRVEFSGELAGSKLKAKYEACSKEKLLKHLKDLAGQQARTLGNGFKLQIDTIKDVLSEKHKKTKEDIEDYIAPRSDAEEISNTFSGYEKYESTI